MQKAPQDKKSDPKRCSFLIFT